MIDSKCVMLCTYYFWIGIHNFKRSCNVKYVQAMELWILVIQPNVFEYFINLCFNIKVDSCWSDCWSVVLNLSRFISLSIWIYFISFYIKSIFLYDELRRRKLLSSLGRAISTICCLALWLFAQWKECYEIFSYCTLTYCVLLGMICDGWN